MLFLLVNFQTLLKSGLGQSMLGIAVQLHGIEKRTAGLVSWAETEFEKCLKQELLKIGRNFYNPKNLTL